MSRAENIATAALAWREAQRWIRKAISERGKRCSPVFEHDTGYHWSCKTCWACVGEGHHSNKAVKAARHAARLAVRRLWYLLDKELQ